jgi:hypothetical protein
MLNSNPETVSTDFDECDRLYFDEVRMRPSRLGRSVYSHAERRAGTGSCRSSACWTFTRWRRPKELWLVWVGSFHRHAGATPRAATHRRAHVVGGCNAEHLSGAARGWSARDGDATADD